eukprot:Sdes_comp20484_c0_seq11m14855
MTSSLVSATWLRQQLLSENISHIKIFDASWYFPFMKRNAFEEYQSKHIPSAQFFDIDKHSLPDASLPHQLPSQAQFEEIASSFGVKKSDHVIVYDGSGCFFSSPRVWFTWKVFGHSKVSVLDGGFQEWQRCNFETESGEVSCVRSKEKYRANFRSEFVVNFDQVSSALREKTHQVLDARKSDRFNGTAPEPRPEISSGHMPNSINIPFTMISDPISNLMLSPTQLLTLFREHNVDVEKPTICSCGSGMTACGLIFSLHLVGKSSCLYGGSWTDWVQSGGEILKTE